GVGRDINRHHYTRAEIDRDLTRPVVVALLALIRHRNTHPAFAGACVAGGQDDRISLTWTHGAHTTSLEASLGSRRATLTWTGTDGQVHRCDNLLDL
ncbi:MAG: sucrose phosphorylase, partial [Dermatophilaceae bacterium]